MNPTLAIGGFDSINQDGGATQARLSRLTRSLHDSSVFKSFFFSEFPSFIFFFLSFAQLSQRGFACGLVVAIAAGGRIIIIIIIVVIIVSVIISCFVLGFLVCFTREGQQTQVWQYHHHFVIVQSLDILMSLHKKPTKISIF